MAPSISRIPWFISAFCLFLVMAESMAQTSRLSGKITDESTGLPIQEAHVFIPNTTFQAFTDSLGAFMITNIPPGKWPFEVWASGFEVNRKELVFKAGIQENLTIVLPADKEKMPTGKDLSKNRQAQIADQLKETLIGTNSKNSQVKFLNPDKLIAEELSDKTFRVYSQGAAFFSNPETGYLVSVHFKPFVLGSGQKVEASYSYFDLPGEEAELALRTKNRLSQYNQSPQKFLSQLMTGDVSSFDSDPRPSVSFGANAGDYFLSFAKPLQIKLPDGGLGVLDYSGEKVELKFSGAPIQPAQLVLGGDFSDDSPILGLPINFNADRVIKLANLEKTAESMQERIYVHTDRRHYWPGENLYFKAYLDYANPVLADELSGVLHLEILDSTGYQWTHQLAEIRSGVAAGHIEMPEVDYGGNFILRAYTAWGQNYNDSDVFLPIQILGHQQQPQSSEIATEVQGINVFSDKQSYKGGENVRLNIQVLNSSGSPANAHLSVSVLDLNQAVALPESQEISESSTPKEANRSFGQFIPVERSFSLQGQLLNANGQPQQGKVQAFVNGYTDERNLSTDKTGLFSFPFMDFKGKFEVALQAKDREVRPIRSINLEVKNYPALEIPQSLLYPKVTARGIRLSPNQMPIPALGEREILMEEAIIEDKRELSVGPMIYGRPDKVVETKNLFLNGSPLQFIYALAGQVAGMQIVGTPPSIRFRSGEPLVLINGTPASSVGGSTLGGGGGGRSAYDVISNLDIMTIERVEVIRRLVPQYGDQGRNGLISIILKTGLDRTEALQSGMNEFTIFDLKGFEEEKTFAEAEQSRSLLPFIAPYRPTLYWNPRLVAQESRMSQQVEFFLNPDSGPIYVEIRGVTDLGVPVFGSFILNQPQTINP